MAEWQIALTATIGTWFAVLVRILTLRPAQSVVDFMPVLTGCWAVIVGIIGTLGFWLIYALRN